MKFKIVILGICAALSACGFGKGERNHLSQEENSSANLFLSNLKTQGYAKLQQTKSGNSFYYLGSFDVSSLPASLRSLPPESEIGTLSVKLEDETYAEKYSDEVRASFSERVLEIKASVYLIPDSDFPNRVYFGMKEDEFAKRLKVSEVPIAVQSAPKAYCSLAHFYIQQIQDKVAVLEQDAPCNPSGVCTILLRLDFPPASKDQAIPYDLNTNQVPITCRERQTYYSVKETKMNRSVPKLGVVHLESWLSGSVRNLKFDL